MATDSASVQAEASLVDELDELQSPRLRPLPLRVRAFLPRPLLSLEHLERLRCEDVHRLTEAEVRCELARLQGALASLADAVDTPPWCWRRRSALLAQLRSAAA